MQKPFKGDYRLTQEWGVNPQAYAKFNLKGHNGTDWGLPNGTEVIAPHDGKVLERANDANGYGNYVKIENNEFGSILAHFQSFSVAVGDIVSAGQVVGLSDNTGNSTGPHLHWGLYPKPRDKSNGYSGTVNPFPYLEGGAMPDSISIPKATFEELVSKSTRWDEVVKVGYESVAQIQQLISDLRKSIDEKNSALEAEKGRADIARTTYNDLIALCAASLGTQQEPNQIKVALEKINEDLNNLDDLEKNYAALQLTSGQKEEELKAEIATLKALLKHENVLRNIDTMTLIMEILKRMTSIINKK